jgi:uncharacterized small protein (TIGR04563 family)
MSPLRRFSNILQGESSCGTYKGVQGRMAPTSDKRKQSLYFPEEMLREIQEEATRQDRSLSWIVQQAWRSARAQIAKMPGMNDLGPSASA